LAFLFDAAWGSRLPLGIELLGNLTSGGSFVAATLSVHIDIIG
jgi:hypothetical protein